MVTTYPDQFEQSGRGWQALSLIDMSSDEILSARWVKQANQPALD